MSRAQRPGVIHVRMAPQLRDGLRAAADAAGCSVNAFVVQIVASAVGDPSRFRAPVEPDVETEPRQIQRDHRGYPTGSRDREIHIGARNRFMIATEQMLGAREMFRLAKQYDADDPGYYVEWDRARRTDQE